MKKRNNIIYWIATIWLAAGMFGSGIQQLLGFEMAGSVSPPGTEGIIKLGYPVYLLTLLGVWKMLGIIALLVPKFPLIKEWAYAGFFFLTTGAIFSHIASGHGFGEIFPGLLLLVLTIVSWYFRPEKFKV
jgi:uncharacterized membrane protein YphA (DoxX/SURF4 family)